MTSPTTIPRTPPVWLGQGCELAQTDHLDGDVWDLYFRKQGSQLREQIHASDIFQQWAQMLPRHARRASGPISPNKHHHPAFQFRPLVACANQEQLPTAALASGSVTASNANFQTRNLKWSQGWIWSRASNTARRMSARNCGMCNSASSMLATTTSSPICDSSTPSMLFVSSKLGGTTFHVSSRASIRRRNLNLLSWLHANLGHPLGNPTCGKGPLPRPLLLLLQAPIVARHSSRRTALAGCVDMMLWSLYCANWTNSLNGTCSLPTPCGLVDCRRHHCLARPHCLRSEALAGTGLGTSTRPGSNVVSPFPFWDQCHSPRCEALGRPGRWLLSSATNPAETSPRTLHVHPPVCEWPVKATKSCSESSMSNAMTATWSDLRAPEAQLRQSNTRASLSLLWHGLPDASPTWTPRRPHVDTFLATQNSCRDHGLIFGGPRLQLGLRPLPTSPNGGHLGLSRFDCFLQVFLAIGHPLHKVFSESLLAVFRITHRMLSCWIPTWLNFDWSSTTIYCSFCTSAALSVCVGNWSASKRNLSNRALASCKRSSCQPPLRPGDERVALFDLNVQCWHCRGAALFQLGSKCVHHWTYLVAHHFQSFLDLLHLLGNCSTGHVRAHTLLWVRCRSVTLWWSLHSRPTNCWCRLLFFFFWDGKMSTITSICTRSVFYDTIFIILNIGMSNIPEPLLNMDFLDDWYKSLWTIGTNVNWMDLTPILRVLTTFGIDCDLCQLEIQLKIS